MDTSNIDLDDIQISGRMWDFVRSNMNSLISVAVELITNADDAHRKTGREHGDIWLIGHENITLPYDFTQGVLNVFEVRDNAIGLSAEDVEKCVLKVGDYTSERYCRGFFSQGLKDISAMGHVIFSTIHNGKFSQAIITMNRKVSMIASDIPVTDELRNLHNIAENGSKVEVVLKSRVKFPGIQFVTDLSNHYALRNINLDPNRTIHFEYYLVDQLVHQTTIDYTKPATKQKIVDMEFTIPEYNTSAKFKLYELEYMASVPLNSYNASYGIQIISEGVVHELSSLSRSLEGSPNMRRIYGTLECDHINQLMYDWQDNIVNNVPDNMNDIPIVDHTRSGRLRRDHPFTSKLLSIPIQRLELILLTMDKQDYDNGVVRASSALQEYLKNMLDHTYVKTDVGDGDWIKTDDVRRSKLVKLQQRKSAAGQVTEDETSVFSLTNIEEALDGQGDVTAKDPSLDIIFRELDDKRYTLYSYGQNYTLVIDKNDPIIDAYFQKDENGEITGELTSTKSKITMATIMDDVFSKYMTKLQYEQEGREGDIELLEAFEDSIDRNKKDIIGDLTNIFVNN